MARTAADKPLDARGQADVERAWAAVQPSLARMRRRYPRRDIDGTAAVYLCRYIRGHDSRGSLEAYAQKIVNHVPSLALRAERPAGAKGDGLPMPQRHPLRDVPDPRPTDPPESEARAILSHLRRPDAETLWLSAVEGLGYCEICRRTGRSEFDVRAALRRARATLRERLGGAG